jgi:hypothetical protein
MQPPPSQQDLESDEPSANKLASSPYPSELDAIYDDNIIKNIAAEHGLLPFSGTLKTTLKYAGGLYLRYSPSSSSFVQDLAPKCRAIARAAELARQLQTQFDEMDFWDRWQIFKRLEMTGHPITSHLDGFTKMNPTMAGNIIVDEIKLILKAATRYEEDFFTDLRAQSQGDKYIGLYFFVEILGAFWESTTGQPVVEPKQGALPRAFAFITDCIAPLGQIDAQSVEASIRRAYG